MDDDIKVAEETLYKVRNLTNSEVEEIRKLTKLLVKNLSINFDQKKMLINSIDSDVVQMVDLFLLCEGLMKNILLNYTGQFQNPELEKKLFAFVKLFEPIRDLSSYYQDYRNHLIDKQYYLRRMTNYIKEYREMMQNFIYFVLGRTEIFMPSGDSFGMFDTSVDTADDLSFIMKDPLGGTPKDAGDKTDSD